MNGEESNGSVCWSSALGTVVDSRDPVGTEISAGGTDQLRADVEDGFDLWERL